MLEQTVPEAPVHGVSFPMRQREITRPEKGWVWPPVPKKYSSTAPELKKRAVLCLVKENGEKLSSDIW